VDKLLQETKMLDFRHLKIDALIESKGWKQLSEKDRILSIYNFVRDEIRFGYNAVDDISASKVLKDGFGQCNTKGTLFMSLLRGCGIPCRVHGFMVDKVMQKGAVTGFAYKQAPKEILHSWVEIFYKDKWLNIEGFILDMKYLNKLQSKFKDCSTNFCGYAVSTPDLQKPQVEWNENDTYIQKVSITQDLGIFDCPDELFSKHKQKLGLIKSFIFRNFARHAMNKNIKKLRGGK
jgi:hypothetical protein